ncbi:ComEC/Rec2 family competence protein [Leptothermofonsia sp. ETS-13]|uniref:ComEC/Rec2 family competence protein n=1 Tax=Leptothermofonsia sp. ETS-13 TaxID=3035696 RepID=UPI003B9F978E
MGLAHGIVLCLAYILGLLSTGVWWGGWLVLILGIGCAVVIPRCWRTAPRARIWLIAGIVGFLASLYFQVRVPQPTAHDVSKLIPPDGNNRELTVQVQGQVESSPRLTRSQKVQFWLEVQQVQVRVGDNNRSPSRSVTGKLYVTVPLLQATGVHVGQQINVLGTLYQPRSAANPGAFDFQKYLAREGCFAGLRGKQVALPETVSGWGWWMVQQRIVRSQIRWLGSPEGPLLSSMVLGSRGVDLPYDLKDQFTRVGLAHALAASGFQTSLILGVVLTLTRRFSGLVQFVLGTLALSIFVGLTGLQPAVLRAALMGFGSLVALLVRRKIKPLGALLVAATLLLLFNPLWIWDLGFQFSFLATLGLLVTVPPLMKRLDWMPSAIASLVAVPIAAYLWTLPLQLYTFGVLSPYTIPVNLVTTPLISILSLGGMVSALAALVWSPAGSAAAWLLKYPTQGLLVVVDWFSQLPGNAYAVGTISALTAIVLYTLLGLTWLQPWWRRKWWLALLVGLGLVIVPAWQARGTLLRVTVLATSGQPVMVIQDAGRTALVNGGGDESTVNFSILPFLQKEGVNELQWAIATESPFPSPGWEKVMNHLPIRLLYAPSPGLKEISSHPSAKRLSSLLPLPTQRAAQMGTIQFRQISIEPAIVEFQVSNQKWLWVGTISPEQQRALLKTGNLPQIQVLWWSGKFLDPALIARLKPEVAIASSKTVHTKTAVYLQSRRIQLFWTGRDGAIEWSPAEGFSTILHPKDNAPSPL